MKIRGRAVTGLQSRRIRRRELTDGQFALLIGMPVIILLAAIVAYPLVYSAWMSVQRVLFFGGYRTKFVGADNFVKVFNDPDFWLSVWVTMRFTAESVILTMLLGLAIGLLLNRQTRLGSLLRTLVFLPWCVSLYGAGLMFAYMARGQTGIATAVLAHFGYTNVPDFMTTTSIIEVLALANSWTMAPLVGFFILANIKTIPSRLYDLAAIDQLSAFTTFRHVTLPPLRFTLFVFTSITTVLSMKLFDLIFVLSGGGPGNTSATLTYELYKVSFKNLDLGYGAAMSFCLLFLIIASTLTLFLVWGRRERQI
jgi:multiple sugar transport system permease protein